jgi:hypothetical protein
MTSPLALHHAFSVLPLELFLDVLDQLIGVGSDPPVAFEPSSSVTQTLRTLTLVSRSVYPIASRYLYSHCLYLDNCTNYAHFRRTIGLNLVYHPQALEYGLASRHELFEDTPRHITSAFISPSKTDKDGKAMPLVRLPQIIDLCRTIGRTLKRLALDFQPVYAVASEIELMRPHISENNIFLHMPQLEELIASYDVLDYFSSPPPNLRRLAVTFQDLKDTQIDFCFATSSLETLFFLRSPELVTADIDLIFSAYKGKSLDVVLVDVNSNHQTPEGTRSWSDDDIVRI